MAYTNHSFSLWQVADICAGLRDNAAMFAHIAVFSPPFRTYTYSLPDSFPADFWRPGLRVLMPLANSLRVGAIISLAEKSDLPQGVACRPVFWPLEAAPLLKEDLLELSAQMARRQGCEQGAMLANFLPGRLKDNSLRLIWSKDNAKLALGINKLRALGLEEKEELAEALLNGKAVFVRKVEDEADLELCELRIQPPWPVRPAAKRQIAVLECLFEHGSMSRKALTAKLGADCAAPIKRLVQSGCVSLRLLEQSGEDSPALYETGRAVFALTEEQLAALADLEQALAAPRAETRLLYGVTGSGKTAVYLELAKKCLRLGKSMFILAPEVALAHKLYLDAKMALGCGVFLYHGYQHQSTRENTFRRLAAANTPAVIVGTRSALFLPVFNPGCIVLDEEHDDSYKQDERSPYHAREVAWQRMQSVNGLLALGSATPDIRVFYASQRGSLPMLRLARRASGARLPEIVLAPLNISAGIGGQPDERGLLTPQCEEALRTCMEKGEQAVILLNRRGYAPQVYCLTCEKTIRCPNCQIGMAFHKANRRLVCHYCGYSLDWPAPCPECGDTAYIPIGEGTEKLAEHLEAIAGKPILRLDRDNVRAAGQIGNILEAFGKGESPFLVGTQMLSKGHHFPNVTLVVVADGDIGLNMPDYRAAERTFQLLTQAAGRAGRGQKPGRAIIQTRNIDHYCWRHVIAHDYEGFYAAELELRRKYVYPPFIRLGLIRISHDAADSEGYAAVRKLGCYLSEQAKKLGIKLLGPAPSPLSMLNGRKRYQCLLKCAAWQPMRELWYFAHQRQEAKKLRLLLDLDPVNMM